MKDDLLLSAPSPIFPDIIGDFVIPNCICVNPSMDASSSDHLQNTLDVNPLFNSGEDKSIIKNPLHLSSAFFGNIEGENSCFSSTPLHNSSNDEDVDKHPKFSDFGYRDLCTSSSDRDVDSLIVNLFKPLVSNDLYINEVEAPHVVEALQPELMVMSGPHCLQASSTYNQEIFETPEARHHSSICTEDQPNTQISLHPLKSHDPIAQALEESYTLSVLAKHNVSVFIMFACMTKYKESACLSYARSMSQHHVKCIGCLSCAFNFLFSMDILELRSCWCALLYILCFLVHLIVLLANHAFTNMG